jgi:hypothetical protein
MFHAGGEDALVPQFDWTVDWPDAMPTCYGLLGGDDGEEYCTEVCHNGYSMDIASSACGSSFEEIVSSGCCPSPYVARYSLQYEGEVHDQFDCVWLNATASTCTSTMETVCFESAAAAGVASDDDGGDEGDDGDCAFAINVDSASGNEVLHLGAALDLESGVGVAFRFAIDDWTVGKLDAEASWADTEIAVVI